MAEDDPYQTLGVKREASAEEIRAAYRKLAKKHHPDLNPGNRAAEERFKAVSAANELLSDPEKRARFDRGEIDAAGQERPERRYYRQHAEGAQGGRYRAQPGAGGGPFGAGFGEEDLGDILGEFFRARGGEGGSIPMRGRDLNLQTEIGFLEAVNGGSRRLTLAGGRSLDLTIPPGVEPGQVLRLRGQGGPGLNGGPAGDVLIEIAVAPHPFFRREGNDILIDLPVTVQEAVLGGRITVPVPGGEVAMTVPPNSDTGTRLRLRGRGVPAHGNRPAGDAYVTLRVTIGPPDPALEAFLRGWTPASTFNPRQHMGGGA